MFFVVLINALLLPLLEVLNEQINDDDDDDDSGGGGGGGGGGDKELFLSSRCNMLRYGAVRYGTWRAAATRKTSVTAVGSDA